MISGTKQDGFVGAKTGGARRRARGVRRSTAALATVLLAVACSVRLPTDEDIDGAVDAAADAAADLSSDLGLGGAGSLDVSVILSKLFPSLSKDEIAEVSGSLTLDAALKLRDELEAGRAAAEEFSSELLVTAEERKNQRDEELGASGAFPESLEALGSVCVYDSETQTASVSLSGVFSGDTAIKLTEGQISVLVDGELQAGELSCLHQGETVDIVLLIDITGSMASVIGSVRDSVVAFTEAVAESGLAGTLSVVTFQDTVGVDVTFQQPAPGKRYERSPFYAPVDLADREAIDELQAFVRALEANLGADAPENLAGAIDFARSSVIGQTGEGPLVIDGTNGPAGTRPFPALKSDRQVLIALTDITFHSDTTQSRSLLPEFRPRPASVILESLLQTGTVVHVVDPSWVDESLTPDGTDQEVDADYWAVQTGGLGEDMVLGYSLLDLELVSVATDTGLLDVVLDRVLASSCHYELQADLSLSAEIELRLEVDGEVFSELIPVTRL